MRHISRVLTLLAALLVAGPARAQPSVDDATRSQARELADHGLSLYESGDYAGALGAFERALALVQAPTLGLLSGRCLEKLGRWVEASERYRLAAAMPVDPQAPQPFQTTQREARENARRERQALLARTPTLKIVVVGANPADVEVRLDGGLLPAAALGLRRPVDPGRHELRARSGASLRTQRLTAGPHDRLEVTLDLAMPRPKPAAEKSGPRPGRPLRTAGYVSLAAGAASLAIGATAWIVALDRQAELDDRCKNRVCPEKDEDAVAGYERWRAVAFAGSAVGVVGLGTGIVLLSTGSRDSGADRLRAWVGAGAAGVRGRF
jgi:hypothetical protein